MFRIYGIMYYYKSVLFTIFVVIGFLNSGTRKQNLELLFYIPFDSPWPRTYVPPLSPQPSTLSDTGDSATCITVSGACYVFRVTFMWSILVLWFVNTGVKIKS